MSSRLPSLLLALMAAAIGRRRLSGHHAAGDEGRDRRHDRARDLATRRRAGRRRGLRAAWRRARGAQSLLAFLDPAARLRVSRRGRDSRVDPAARAARSRRDARRPCMGRDRRPLDRGGDRRAAAGWPVAAVVPGPFPDLAGSEISNDRLARLPWRRGGGARGQRRGAVRRDGDTLPSRSVTGRSNGLRARAVRRCAWRTQRQPLDRSRPQTTALSRGVGGPAPDPSHQHDVH